MNPFFRTNQIAQIDEEQDLNDYSHLSLGNDNLEELSTEQKKLIQELEDDGLDE